jgi:hypothetical protein
MSGITRKSSRSEAKIRKFFHRRLSSRAKLWVRAVREGRLVAVGRDDKDGTEPIYLASAN